MTTPRPPNQRATLAQAQGMTEEIGRAIAAYGARELQEDRLESARDILEGLAVMNPHDPAPWALLAQLQRRRGEPLAARFCAEVAYRLAPHDPQVRIVRAELLLGSAPERDTARSELAALAAEEAADARASGRAKALLAALGS